MTVTPRTIFCFLIVISLSATAFRSDDTVMHPSDDFATVYIYRTGQFMDATMNYALFANEQKICELSNNKYIEHHLKPGHVVYMANQTGVNLFKKETGFALDVEAGKKYFIQCAVKRSFTRSRMEMSEVTENTAKRDMEKLTADNCQAALNGK